MKYLDYRKKLGIGFNNNQLESFFLQRMKNHLEIIRSDATYDHLANPRMVFDYCNITGADFEGMDTSYCLDSIIQSSFLLHLLLNYVGISQCGHLLLPQLR